MRSVGRVVALGVWLIATLADYGLPTTALALDPDRPLAQAHRMNWGADQGLTGTPHALAQTTDGRLWVGTFNGLFRFDGVRFGRRAKDTNGLLEL